MIEKKTNSRTCAKTEYKGVLWIERFKKYRAHITEKGIKHPCGLYETPKEAAMARDLAIIKLRLNPKKLQILKSVTT